MDNATKTTCFSVEQPPFTSEDYCKQCSITGAITPNDIPMADDTALQHSHDEPEHNDAVNHPSHYTYGTIETIDYIEDKEFTYNLGNAIKYISRAGHKLDAIEDLEKAVWYVKREIQRLKKVKSSEGLEN